MQQKIKNKQNQEITSRVSLAVSLLMSLECLSRASPEFLSKYNIPGVRDWKEMADDIDEVEYIGVSAESIIPSLYHEE